LQAIKSNSKPKILILLLGCILNSVSSTIANEKDDWIKPPVISPAEVSSKGIASQQYKRYVNPRFQYRIDYPSFLTPGREPENGDGLRFKSADGKTELIVYGQSAYATVNGEAWTIPSLLADALASRKRDGDKVTYKKQGKDWFVLSGYSGSKIFYSKTIIHDDNVKCFELRYPTANKVAFDPIVGHLVGSFVNTSADTK
jgi:hypothetical protein